MVGRPVEEMFLRRGSPTGDVVLDVRDLTVLDPAIPGRRILDRVSLSVRAGEVVCVAGLMGAGRTELLSSIFGRRVGVRTGGTISLHGVPLDSSGPGSAIARGVGLVPEDRKNEGIVPCLSVTDNLALVHGSAFSSAGFLRSVALTAACRSLVDRLHIKVPGLDAAVEALSGGNQQKVALGKWFLGAPGLLLLDEPTRGIDVGAKAELYALINALAASGVALLVVSSDLPEVIGLADRILVLRRGRVAGELHGTVTQEQIMELAA
jgi:ABC-type sugar transport system ATPase subunit